MNRWFAGCGGIWLAGMLSLEANAQVCLPFIDRLQPITAGKVIVVGRARETPHVVVVPASSPATLNAVRQCVPTAFLTNSRLGDYIHAGAFANYNQAASLSAMLRSRGLDARVVYLP
jgi:hypothetical protein